MISQSITSSLDCCVIWLDWWTTVWWHHYSLNPRKQHGRWVRAEPLVSVVRLIITQLEEPNHWPEASFWRSSEKKLSRQKYAAGHLQPDASSLHSDCNRLYGFMCLMPGSIRQPQWSFFLVALSLKFLIQPTWIIFASVCGCISLVMMEWWPTVVCTLVFRRLQSSHLWLSSNEELECVWLASVHNNGLTSLAALRSLAGFGARVTRIVGGSFFSSASLALFSTEQSPEDGQTKKDTTNGGMRFWRTPTLQTSIYYLLFKVSSVLLIHQHQVKEVAHGELLVDVPHGGCQIIPCRRQQMPPSPNNFKQWSATTLKQEELPARKSLMGIDSPLTGAPSMISYFATVSVSVVVLGPKQHNTPA